MGIWNQPAGGDGVADVEQGIINSSSQLQQDAATGAYAAIQSALGANLIPSWADVQAIHGTKSGLQRVAFEITAPTTELELLSVFAGIGYGLWKICVSVSVADATFRILGTSGGVVWNFNRTLIFGSSLSLGSDGEYLWRSPLGEGVKITKDALSTITLELWFDYVYV